jgi:hypothetical protein
VMVLCEPIGLRVSGIHSGVLCVRREKEKRSLLKKRERCTGWASQQVGVVCVNGYRYMCMGRGVKVVV